VFDHQYHFDHLLDTAFEVEGGSSGFSFANNSPHDAASPLSSQGDLAEMGAGAGTGVCSCVRLRVAGMGGCCA
jgi:hypothetical protein